jgi:amino acid transporter
MASSATSSSNSYGLRANALSPMETLAQSISTIAPTASPVVTIPLVCGLAGNGTWLAYLLATSAILLVAVCISHYARHSASPGSLYTYVEMTLPHSLSAVAAWSLLLAYIATASSVTGGFYHYANLLLHDAGSHGASAAALAIAVTLVSAAIAWRDVKVSARLMLWIEGASVTLIVILVALVLLRHGAHLDLMQLHLVGMTGGGLRLGLVLALFSFVGFESATTLGSEARDPLKTIPRAVIQSAVLCGAMFTICSYAEVLGFRVAGQNLGESQAPMRVLAVVAGAPILGLLIDVFALVSLFACTLACITAAARVLLLMSHNGLTHGGLRVTHSRFETPARAIVVTAIAAVAPPAILGARGASGLDVYGWLGSLATYGFIVTYALVCFALPRYLKDHGAAGSAPKLLSWAACAAMLLALVGNLYPVPEGPYAKFPYIYLAYLAFGMLWYFASSRRKPQPV